MVLYTYNIALWKLETFENNMIGDQKHRDSSAQNQLHHTFIKLDCLVKKKLTICQDMKLLGITFIQTSLLGTQRCCDVVTTSTNVIDIVKTSQRRVPIGK